MKDFRVSTAQHWLKAWKDGKHIRNSQLTIEDYNKRRRAYCAEYKQRAEEAKKSWEKTLEILRSGHESDHAFEPGEGYPARMYCITCGGSETDHR
jgi:hypothetical protein